jgi:broad specificity phosphatase PhoE
VPCVSSAGEAALFVVTVCCWPKLMSSSRASPSDVLCRYVSPRTRAQRTFELLNLGLREPLPWKAHGPPAASPGLTCDASIEVTEDIREWDYGSYEGVTSAAIREERWRTDLDPNWDIWRDGCPEGE